MSLFLSTLLVGLFLLLLGGALLADTSLVRSTLKAFPRSKRAAYVLFGLAAVWFLHRVANLSEADFGQFSNLLLAVFGAVAVLSFFYVAEFLAVRGLATLILLAAGPLLTSAFGEYDIPARLFMVSIVYLALTVAIVLGAQPWRMRDAIEWLQRMPGRARVAGSALTAYGLLLVGVAFTY
jgi:hypothetical protein